MTRHDLVIVLAVLAWIASFTASLAIPAVRLDPTLNLVLMGVVGGLIALRQRRQEGPS